MNQDLSHSGGPLIPYRYRYGKFTKYICHYQDIFEPVPGSFQLREIDGQDLIGSGGKQVAYKAMWHVPRLLSDLATLTLWDPVLYVWRHSWPITLLSDQSVVRSMPWWPCSWWSWFNVSCLRTAGNISWRDSSPPSERKTKQRRTLSFSTRWSHWSKFAMTGLENCCLSPKHLCSRNFSVMAPLSARNSSFMEL